MTSSVTLDKLVDFYLSLGFCICKMDPQKISLRYILKITYKINMKLAYLCNCQQLRHCRLDKVSHQKEMESVWGIWLSSQGKF